MGRIARSWHLLGRCWELLTERPKLLVMPALSALSVTAAALVIFLPVLWWTRQLPDKVSVVIATAAAALPFTLLSTTANVAFLSMVEAHMRGETPSVRAGLRFAWLRRWPILGWSALASGVGALLNALQHLPGVEWVGRLVGFLGGLAWGLATFFAVPVLVVEGRGPFAAVRRSVSVFRRRWGETVAGDISIGVVFGILMIPGIALVCGGVAAFDHDAATTGTILLCIGIGLVAPILAIEAAMTQLFQLALFRHTTAGELPRPFTTEDAEIALTPRRKWL